MVDEHARSEVTVARGGFLSGVGRRWSWILGATLAGLLASAVFIQVVPPRYAGVATARLDPAARTDSLASVELARAAIDRLGLAADPEFGGDDAPGRGAADTFLSRLSVASSPRPREIEITFVSRDPELAARGANTVAELAVQSLNEARARSVRAVETWLGRKIEDGEVKVADADAKLQAQRAQSHLLSGADGQPAGGEPASDLNAKLSAARAAEAEAADKAALLRKLAREGRLADAPPSIADEFLRRLLDQRVTLKAEIAEASRTLLPLHPRMKDLASQLAALDGQIRDAADRATRTSEIKAREAGDEADALAVRLKAAAAASGADASLHALEAEAQAAGNELASYQQMARENETRAAAEAEAGDARIVARADPPRAPVFPRIGPTLLAGAATGFVLSSLAAAVAAIVASRRRANPPPADVAPAMKVAPATARAGSATGFSALSEALGPAPEAFGAAGAPENAAELIATLRRLKPKGGLVALVAGDRTGLALPVALESARGFAGDCAAVFVDLGETQDWLADILHREDQDEPAILGLSDLIAGRAGFGEVIRRDLSSNLDVVLPGRKRGAGAIDDALTAFEAAYETVVLHASDWRGDRARAAAAFADAVVVVAPAARVSAARGAAEAAIGDACPTVLAYAVRTTQKTPELVG
jgi:polysaccharide biosynthesis transport protein